MLISTRGRYTLRLLVELAEHGDAVCVPLGELAREQGISEKYLEQLARTLVSHGILESSCGRAGGYRLKRPPEQITLWEVLELTEGSLASVGCRKKDAEPCTRQTVCRAVPLWEELDGAIRGVLSGHTVADLAHSGENSEEAEEPAAPEDSEEPEELDAPEAPISPGKARAAHHPIQEAVKAVR